MRGRPPGQPDPDPANVAGLLYRVLSRWRVLLGAAVIIVVVVGVVVIATHLLGPVRVEIGPVGVEPVPGVSY
jgi:hypothetical protein